MSKFTELIELLSEKELDQLNDWQNRNVRLEIKKYASGKVKGVEESSVNATDKQNGEFMMVCEICGILNIHEDKTRTYCMICLAPLWNDPSQAVSSDGFRDVFRSARWHLVVQFIFSWG